MKNILENLSADDIIKDVHAGIDAPYIHVGRTALGGTPIITVCLKAKKDWSHGILENEIYAYWNIDENGTVENWSRFSRDIPKHRKFKAKSLVDAIERINKHVQGAIAFLL